MRVYFPLVLASAALLVGFGKAESPAYILPQHAYSTVHSNSRTTETPSAILANNSRSSAVIVAANPESAKLGTGFFVGRGLLLTNFHVIQNTTMVGIRLESSGTPILTTRAEGYDLQNDLAILHVNGVDTQPVTLGDSDKVVPGQPVVVVGNPEGLEQTVSNGLVSAIREFNGRKLFQISAPISEGSSGSPVFNDHGEVIGVVVSSIEKGQNLNFAVPINYAKPLLEQSTEEPISSLPKRNGMEAQIQRGQSPAPDEAGPTLAETLEWLVEKVRNAGYTSCHSQGKTLGCLRTHYESVKAGDCKLSFTDVTDLVGRQTIRNSSKETLSLRAASPDISVDSLTLSYPCHKGGCGKDYGDQKIFFVGRPSVGGVYFRSKDLADRVARAMNHAIDLCGPEPF
jgi:S1-C subfamily serine protease